MNTVLVATTFVALAVAAASLLLAYTAFRRDRRRSEARVAALRELAGGFEPAGDVPISPVNDDLPIRTATIDEPEDTVARPMFGGGRAASPWPKRLAAAAGTAVVVAALAYALVPRGGAAPAQPAQANPAPAQLELLSLRHAQEKGKLIITGLVQNPRAGGTLTKVVATAFLFGADGTFLASGRAPLDFSTLAPGDESPFVLEVASTAPVARYRVGFRGDDGRVIAHVDRRTTGTLARTGE